jgi:hypothetical protein
MKIPVRATYDLLIGGGTSNAVETAVRESRDGNKQKA